MKHYFIVNPVAGGIDSTEKIINETNEIFASHPEDCQVIVTKKTYDATEIVDRICTANDNLIIPEELVFYACGGDGTCFEVVNGLAMHKHVSFTIVPIGSCNDFLKSYPDYNFLSIASLVNGQTKVLDLLKVNEYYSLNVCNIGFDAKVNYDCVKNRSKYKTVKQSYNAAIVKHLFKPLGDMVTVICDDKEYFHGKALLMSFANGEYYGGGYHCAPYAKCDDGYLEVGIVKKISRISFLMLIKHYKIGDHYEQKSAPKKMMHGRFRKVLIKSDKPLIVTIDGESFFWTDINIKIVPRAIKVVFPSK